MAEAAARTQYALGPRCGSKGGEACSVQVAPWTWELIFQSKHCAIDLTAPEEGFCLLVEPASSPSTCARLGGNRASVLQGLEAYRGPHWHQNCCPDPQPCAEVLLQAGEGAGGRGQRCSPPFQDSAGSDAGAACAASSCLLAASGRRTSTPFQLHPFLCGGLLGVVPCWA